MRETTTAESDTPQKTILQYPRGRERLSAIAPGGQGAEDSHSVQVFDTADWPRLEEPDGAAPSWVPRRWRAVRFDPGRHGAAALVTLGALALAVVFFSVWHDRPRAQAVPPLPVVEATSSPSGRPSSAETEPPKSPPDVVVSVVGLVHVPGLVHLPDGARIADALAAAGGVREGGDTIALNLAQRVVDGDQVVVGVDTGEPPVSTGPEGPQGVSGSAAAPGLVDLNSADESALESLPGVGPVTASAIIAWRTANGEFTSVDQLGEVDGIGPVRLEKLRSLVDV